MDEDSPEEVIVVNSPQQSTLTEQNILKLMTNKCKEYSSRNILKSNPSAAAYVLRSDKKNDNTTNPNTVADGWSEEEDDEDEDENNDEQLHSATVTVRRTTPFDRTGFID